MLRDQILLVSSWIVFSLNYWRDLDFHEHFTKQKFQEKCLVRATEREMSVWSMGMSAIRTKCPIHYYFLYYPNYTLLYLPKFCITIVFNLSLGITVRRPQRNWRQCKILGDKPRCITGNEKMVNIICALDTNQESKIQVLKNHNDR